MKRTQLLFVLSLTIFVTNSAICKESGIQFEIFKTKEAIDYNWYPEVYLNNSQFVNLTTVQYKSLDYAIVGVEGNGCGDPDSVKNEVFGITLNPSDTTICNGDSLLLVPEVQGNVDGIAYYWSPDIDISDVNAASPKVFPSVSKQYRVEIINAEGCIDKDSVFIDVITESNLDFEYNLSARCSGAILEINNRSTNTDGFEWILNGISRSTAYEPTFEIDHQKENRLVLKGSNALCSDSVVEIIPPHTFDEVIKLNKVNAFSPNGDGINDIFNAGFDGEFIGCASFTIYDRWGAKVFDTNIGQYGWDGRTMGGKKAPEGTYYYIINFAGKEIKGSVYLSR